MKPAPLFVVAGPTAVGKGTVVAALRSRHPDLPQSVSATTRDPRPGEVSGVDYFFVSDGEFDRMVDRGEFLEWAVVHSIHRYGTPAAWVEEQRSAGRPVLLELDLAGARQVKRKIPDAVLIFIAPPAWEDLQRRLVSRGTETLEEQSRRLRTARDEMAASGEFNVVLVNHDVDRTAAELAQVMGLN